MTSNIYNVEITQQMTVKTFVKRKDIFFSNKYQQN